MRHNVILIVFLFVAAAGRPQTKTVQVAGKQPLDYVNPLIGTAPQPDKAYLGGNPVPDEELYYGCVNPGARVPDPYRMTRGPKYSWFPFYSNPGVIASRGADWVAKRTANITSGWGGGFFGGGRVAGIVGLYKMGFRNNDTNCVYEKIRNEAMNGGGTAGIAYREYGYIPSDAGIEDCVNRTIGYAYDDYALAELATIFEKPVDHDFFLERSKKYIKLFNPSTGFFTPRKKDGSWIEGLDPAEPHAGEYYREGNAWNYLWYQTGDMAGLIDLLGGTGRFIARLDTFFTAEFNPKVPLRDFTGILGLYSHGNEQYRHGPYLYNYGGQLCSKRSGG